MRVFIYLCIAVAALLSACTTPPSQPMASTHDEIDMLEFKLKPNAMITIQYPDVDGEAESKTITIKKQKAIQKIKLRWEKKQ